MATVTLQQIKGSPLTNTEFETNLTNINAETVDNSGLYKLRPSLDVDLVGTKSVSPYMGFSRSSTGTYYDQNGILKTAAINEPRFDYDPITGELKGLLIEDSRTNLLTYSQDIANPIWIPTNVSIDTINVTAPDRTVTAQKLIENTVDNNHYITTGNSISYSTDHSISIYAKVVPNSLTNILKILLPYNSLGGTTNISRIVAYDLLNGNISYDASQIIASIVYIGDGWYKCSASRTPVQPTYTNKPAIALSRNFSNTVLDSYQGDGTSGIYIWGAQLEQGSTPTSYIPTTSVTVTRSADTLTINKNTNWFNSVNGTLALSHDAVSGQPILGEGSNTLLTSLGAGITNIDYSNSQLAVVTQTGQTVNTQGIFNFDSDLYVLGNSTSKANAHVKYLKFYPNNVIGSTPSGSGFILDDGYALLQEDNSVIFQE